MKSKVEKSVVLALRVEWVPSPEFEPRSFELVASSYDGLHRQVKKQQSAVKRYYPRGSIQFGVLTKVVEECSKPFSSYNINPK